MTYLITDFSNRFRAAFSDYAAGRPVPDGWRIAFEAYDSGDANAGQDVLLFSSVHVQHDLPFAYEEMGTATPAGDSRKPDHDAVNAINREVFDPIQDYISAHYDPSFGVIDGGPSPLDETATLELVETWRENGWRYGEQLLAAKTEAERDAVVADIEENARSWAETIVRRRHPRDPRPARLLLRRQPRVRMNRDRSVTLGPGARAKRDRIGVDHAIALLLGSAHASAKEPARESSAARRRRSTPSRGRWPSPSSERERTYDRQFCGASLVAPTVAVTAAHCVYDTGAVCLPIDGFNTPASAMSTIVGRTSLNGRAVPRSRSRRSSTSSRARAEPGWPRRSRAATARVSTAATRARGTWCCSSSRARRRRRQGRSRSRVPTKPPPGRRARRRSRVAGARCRREGSSRRAPCGPDQRPCRFGLRGRHTAGRTSPRRCSAQASPPAARTPARATAVARSSFR